MFNRTVQYRTITVQLKNRVVTGIIYITVRYCTVCTVNIYLATRALSLEFYDHDHDRKKNSMCIKNYRTVVQQEPKPLIYMTLMYF
jgi:hypothetical protein